MTGAQDATEMYTNMLMATGILIGTVLVLVVVGLVVYYRTARDRQETEDEVWS
jgi:heme/copper-type cytochrome/quinol oxidase subunit 2